MEMVKDSTDQVKAAELEALEEKDEVFSNVSSFKDDLLDSNSDSDSDKEGLMEVNCEICNKKQMTGIVTCEWDSSSDWIRCGACGMSKFAHKKCI